MELAKDIIQYRAKNNMSQEKFAELVGVAKTTIYGIEAGKTTATKLTEAKIRLVIGESNGENT